METQDACVILSQVSEIESRSALIQLTAPESDPQEFDIHPSEFKYELQLSEKKDSKYKPVYRWVLSGFKMLHGSGSSILRNKMSCQRTYNLY